MYAGSISSRQTSSSSLSSHSGADGSDIDQDAGHSNPSVQGSVSDQNSLAQLPLSSKLSETPKQTADDLEERVRYMNSPSPSENMSPMFPESSRSQHSNYATLPLPEPEPTSLSFWNKLIHSAQNWSHGGIATLTIASVLLVSATAVAFFVFEHIVAWLFLALSALVILALAFIGVEKCLAGKAPTTHQEHIREALLAA